MTTTEHTLSFGSNLLQSGPESLQLVSERELYERIQQPDAALTKLCAQLKHVHGLNPKAYEQLKKQLPFFCGSVFEQSWRRLEHFQEARYLVLDLDKCFESAEQFQALKDRLKADDRVLLLFESPSRQGLKLLFSLGEKPLRCTQTFSTVYSNFSRSFAAQHGLEAYTDFKTKDATRVCFLSADEQAWYNPIPTELDWADWESQFPMVQQPRMPRHEAEVRLPSKTEQNDQQANTRQVGHPDDASYQVILEKLNPRHKPRAKQIFVPERLHEVAGSISKRLNAEGIRVDELQDINYGQKWKLSLNNAQAEVNVFWGKRGFSVVAVSRSGTHPALNEVAQALIEEALFAPP